MSRIANDRLQAAVTLLAGQGPLKDRIATAWGSHLEELDPLMLPEPLRAEFVLMGALLHSARALPGDTVVRASARKLSPMEAEQCAGFLVRALAATAEQAGRAECEAAMHLVESDRPALRIASAS